MTKQQQITKSDDGGEKIVEVMRHAAGKLAYGLHLLALHELRLKPLLFGQIDKVKDDGIAILDFTGMHLRRYCFFVFEHDFDRLGQLLPLADTGECL